MVTAIVLAAGVGSRMKSEKAKQFLEVAGHEVLYYSLRAFDEHPEVDSIVLVTKEEFVEHCQKELAERYQFAKVRDICIGGKERIARAAAKDHNTVFFHVPYRTVADIGLRELFHGYSGLNAHRHIQRFQCIGQGQRVDNGSQHTHVVCTSPVHFTAGAATPKVAAADNDAHLYSQCLDCGFYIFADLQHHIIIDAIPLLPGKSFYAQLQNHTLIANFQRTVTTQSVFPLWLIPLLLNYYT